MKKTILILSGLAVLGIGAYAYYTQQVKLLTDMSYDIQSIKIVRVQGSDITLNVKIKFTSTADLEVKVKSLYLDLYLDGIYAGNTSANNAFVVPAKGYNYATFDISLNLGTVVSNIMNLISSGNLNKKFDLVSIGKVNVNTGIISANLPVRFDYPFTIQDLLTRK